MTSTPPGTPKTDRVAVVGAGQMGRGIAQVAAEVGIDVHLLDASDAQAGQGKDRIGSSLQRLVDKEKIDGARREDILGRIHPAGSLEAVRDVPFLIEATPEQLQVKAELFVTADQALRPDAIFASNTSSISLTKLAAATRRPKRVIGMHFMNPVPVMQLLEIVRALQTSEETFRTTWALGERMGKTLISAKDMPGFIVNRMLIPFLNEACFALQDSLGTVEDIDAGAKLGLNHPMGPFELADLIGLDTVLYIAEVLHREFGEDKYRPPAILRNYVAAGWLGRKSGRGFYRYDDGSL